MPTVVRGEILYKIVKSEVRAKMSTKSYDFSKSVESLLEEADTGYLLDQKEVCETMEKKPFRYRNRAIAIMWILIVGIPIGWFVPEILSSLVGNIIVSIGLVFFLLRNINNLPGVSQVGYYGKENGVTQIEYAGKSLRLNHVNSIFLSDKSIISQGVILQIQNNGKKITFLSPPVKKSRTTGCQTL